MSIHDISAFLENPGALVDVVRQVVGQVVADLEGQRGIPDFEGKATQLKEISRTISKLEAAGVAVPDDLRRLKTDLVEELSQRDEMERKLSVLETGLRECLAQIRGTRVKIPVQQKETRSRGSGAGTGSIVGTKTLEDLFQIRKTWPEGRACPRSVRFPDGTEVPVRKWRDLDTEVVGWLGRRHELPVPFASSERGDKYFLNTRPEHGSPDWDGLWARVEVRGRELFLDYQINANRHVECLRRLCGTVGEDPAEFVVELDMPVGLGE